MAAALLLAGAVGLLALPSAVLAFTARFEPDVPPQETTESMGALDSDPTGSEMARAISIRSLAKGQLFPFTPAGLANRPDRSVTVAVRVDPRTVKEITVRRARINAQNDSDGAQLRIAPTAFNLGVSRGYRNFAQDLVSSDERAGKLHDFSRFSIAPQATSDDSRFSPHIVIDERQRTGRAPRTFAGDREGRVDVGGSYRVTENLDVTAGVRYSEERERLLPLTDGKQDGQAVYVGTQFRF